jgi:hypothetical protein
MYMKKNFFLCFIIVAVSACNNNDKKIPDVSGIQVSVNVNRFDQDFFAIDTNNVEGSINVLNEKYPVLLPIYLENIIGVTDPSGVKIFYRLHKAVFDTAQIVYKNFNSVKDQITQAYKYVKHYYPEYSVPKTIIPILGPMNSIQDMARMENGEYTPNFLSADFLGISLQFYLGTDYSLYRNEYFVTNVAPLYRSRRFAKEYIVGDVMKLVTQDIMPDKSKGKPLVQQMIEKGKQWWLIDKFLPREADSIKTGYTAQQLEWCEENEALIWSYIVKNEDLNSVNPVTLQTYIGEAPFTQGFSQEFSPGNIGQWIGWQIVKKFEEKNPGMTPKQLMQIDAKQILEEARYKPN